MNALRVDFCAILGFIGSAIAYSFGGWTSAMSTLVIFMAVDFLTGLIVAAFFRASSKTESGGLSSIVSFRGLSKKVAILALVVVAYRLDLMLETDYIKNATVVGFSVNELISIVENLGLMGVPLPSVIQKAIDVLTSKGDKDENNHSK